MIDFDMEKAVEIKYIHASGPGGQNVNKVATAAQLRFDPQAAGLSPVQIARLKTLVPGRLSRDGHLTITARSHRSQALNKAEALERLQRLLALAAAPPPKPRRATRPSRRAEEKRLEEKKRRSRNKLSRKSVDSWSHE